MAVWQWSKTASSNATADPTMNWAEGIPPSIVDDNDRAMMARLAEYRDDISGSLTTAGTSIAYTLTTNQGLSTPTPPTGQLIAFVPNVTNGASATLAADGGSAYPLQSAPGTAIGAGVLIQGSPYTAMFNGTAWLLRNMFAGNPYNTALGALMLSTTTTPPNSNFILPFGQAISRTTYAAYFSLVGTTYGAGDGSTTFNVIDVRGCALVPLDNLGGSAAGRIGTALVTDGGTINGQQLGSGGGSQSHVQTTSELVTHSHPNSLNDLGHSHAPPSSAHWVNISASASGFTTANPGGTIDGGTGNTATATTGMSITNANQGSSAAMAWLQPTRMCSCFLRVI